MGKNIVRFFPSSGRKYLTLVEPLNFKTLLRLDKTFVCVITCPRGKVTVDKVAVDGVSGQRCIQIASWSL